MPNTMNLLADALKIQPTPYWTKKLNLSLNTLHTSKIRNHLSPAIAGALADELGQDVQRWVVIAALESEKDSACKSRLLEKIRLMHIEEIEIA